MTGAACLAGLVAMVPAMLGPPHESREFALALCGAGTTDLNIPRDGLPEPEGECSKGCHSSCHRRRIDLAQ